MQWQRRLHVRTLCVQRGLVSVQWAAASGPSPWVPRLCLTRRELRFLGVSRSKHFELLRYRGCSWKDVQESGPSGMGAGAWDGPGRETDFSLHAFCILTHTHVLPSQKGAHKGSVC